MYKILYNENYIKKARKFIKRHPQLLPQYEKTLKLLEIDPFHPSLRLHKLSGNLSELHSISINLSYRILIYFMIKDGKIIPIDLGSHDGVY